MMPNIELPFRKKSVWRFIAKQIFAFFLFLNKYLWNLYRLYHVACRKIKLKG